MASMASMTSMTTMTTTPTGKHTSVGAGDRVEQLVERREFLEVLLQLQHLLDGRDLDAQRPRWTCTCGRAVAARNLTTGPCSSS